MTDLIYLGWAIGWTISGVNLLLKSGFALQRCLHLSTILDFTTGRFVWPTGKQRKFVQQPRTVCARGIVSPRDIAEMLGAVWAARLSVGPGLHTMRWRWLASRIRPAVKVVLLERGSRLPPTLARAARFSVYKDDGSLRRTPQLHFHDDAVPSLV